MTEEQEMEGSRQGDGRRAWMETAETETEMAMEIGSLPAMGSSTVQPADMTAAPATGFLPTYPSIHN